MTYKDILNADLSTVAQWMRQGFAWWTDELAQLLPASWRKHMSARREVVAEFGPSRVAFRGRSGQPIELAALSSSERENVHIVIPMRHVLTRVLEFPILPMADIRRMVAMEIDRFTPFHAESVYFDTELVRRDAERGRQQILLGVLPKSSAGEVLARAQEMGVLPSAFGASAGADVHFDFLPALRAAGGTLSARARVPYWWIVIGLLMVLNVLVLTYRDTKDIESLRTVVDAQSGPVELAMRLRAKAQAEADRRTVLVDRLKKSSPLRIIEAVTKALPPNAWTQTFEWDGQTVHLIGYSNGPADILRALESSPALHNAHTMSHDAVAVKQAGAQPFDVAAEAGKGGKR